MESPDIPIGHLGNLSTGQQGALKDMWACFYALQSDSGEVQSRYGTPVSMTEASQWVKECGGYEKFHSAFWASPFAGHPDSTMLRFLRARKFDVSAGIAMLANAIKWRVEVGADKIIEQGEEVLNCDLPGFDLQMKSGKTYIHGTDRQSRPIYYIHVQLHNPKAQAFEVLRDFTIYGVETGRSFLSPPTNQICLLFDMTGFGLKNMDWQYILFLVKAFEAYYPETLGTLIFHGAPWIFGGIWRVLKPLLDPVIASKFVFTRTDQELFEYVHPDQLIKSLGGNDQWTWSYTDCIDGENTRLRDEPLSAQWKSKRAAALERVEEASKSWIANDAQTAVAAREQAIAEYRATSIEADPYIRPRTVYHRHGNLLEDGTVFWHYESAASDQVYGTPVGKLKEEARLADGKDGVSKDFGENAAANATKEDDSVPVGKLTEETQSPHGKDGVSKDTGENAGDVNTSVGKLKEQAQVADGKGIFSEELDETVVVSAVNGDVHSSS